MKKTTLGLKQNDLVKLAKEIREREEVIVAVKAKTIERANEWICEVVLQGQCLNKAKALLQHGTFIEWLRIHCPTIGHTTAWRYMRVATHWGLMTERVLHETVSLRAALSLCDAAANPDEENEVPKVIPPYLEGLSRGAKFAAYLTKYPLRSWPEAGRAKLRSDLSPLVAELWPDKFKK